MSRCELEIVAKKALARARACSRCRCGLRAEEACDAVGLSRFDAMRCAAGVRCGALRFDREKKKETAIFRRLKASPDGLFGPTVRCKSQVDDGDVDRQ